MNLTPFGAYKKYLAIKLHFCSESYDYFRCHGEVRASESAFEKRNDKFFFNRLCKKYPEKELIKYLVCNFLEDSQNWVGDIISVENDDSYKIWQKKIQALSYNFKQDLQKLNEEIVSGRIKCFDDLFKLGNSSHPYILEMTLRKDIAIETFVIMNRVLNFFPLFDKTIKNKIIWREFKKKCLKYEPFLEIKDYSKFKQIMKECFV